MSSLEPHSGIHIHTHICIYSRAGTARVLVLDDDLFWAVLVFTLATAVTHHTLLTGKTTPLHFWQIMKCDHLMTHRITRMEGPKLAKVRATNEFTQFSHSRWCGFFYLLFPSPPRFLCSTSPPCLLPSFPFACIVPQCSKHSLLRAYRL